MYTIAKEIEFDAGHRVPLHESKCKNPHGHRYKVEAEVAGELIEEGPETGMVRDFSIIKELLTKRVHDVYDHGFMVYKDDHEMDLFVNMCLTYNWKCIITDFIPTAECLAKAIFDDLKSHLPGLFQVNVYETPTSLATYAPDDNLFDPPGRFDKP